MDITLNWLAIGIATLSTMVVGTVWYLPKMFGNRWQALTGVDPNKPKSKAAAYGGSFAASAVTAIALAVVIDLVAPAVDQPFLVVALVTGGILWAGFTAARILVHELFESRDLRIWGITAAYELVTILVMAAIIGLFGN